MLISVVLAVYNGSQTLQRCIFSVIQQTYPSVELIIIDGGSTDGSIEIIRHNQKSINYWDSAPDRGIYHAWNKAIPHARGEWICFLGADDFFWAPDVLERMLPHLQTAYPACRVVYGKVNIVGENESVLYTIGEPWEKAGPHFKTRMSIPHPGTMHHRHLFEKHGLFDESFRVTGDYEFLMRELLDGRAHHVPGFVVAGMQHGGVSKRPETTPMVLREIARARRKNGLKIFSLHLASRWCRVWFRMVLTKCFGPKIGAGAADFYRICNGKPRLWTLIEKDEDQARTDRR